MWAVLLAAIGLVLASLTGRRAYATGDRRDLLLPDLTCPLLLIEIRGRAPAPLRLDAVGADRRADQPVHHAGRGAEWLGGTTPGEIRQSRPLRRRSTG
jgi:hypothetical protein